MGKPKQKKEGRIESDNYAIGYALPINGQYRVHVSTKVVYTGLKVTKANVPKVKAIIDKLAKEHQDKKLLKRAGIAMPKQATPVASIAAEPLPSFYDAASRWYDEFYKGNNDVGKARRRQVLTTIAHYTPRGFDIPLTPTVETLQRLVDHFTRIRSRQRYADNTIKRHLTTWQQAFAWMVDQGWILRNPIRQLRMPDRQTRPNELRSYEKRELSQTMRELERIDPEVRLLCLWLRLTGNRIEETLTMKREHITATGVTLFGKGRKNKKRLRRLPFAPGPLEGYAPIVIWQRMLQRVIALQQRRIDQVLSGEIPTYATRKKRYQQGYVWGIASQSRVRTILKKAKERAGTAIGDWRGCHAFRAEAEHRMINRAGLPKEQALEIVGHSERIFEEHYKIEQTGVELVTTLTRLIAVQSQQNSAKT